MRYGVNISIDDISPHPRSSTKVLDRCFELIDQFPDIKFTLFLPMAYWRTVGDTATPQPLRVDQDEEFLKKIFSLPDKNFELAYHGLYHGTPKVSNNDEFRYLTEEEANEKFEIMFKVAESCGLRKKMKNVFRPPAWRMSPDAFKSARNNGFDILALSPKKYAKDTYCGQEDEYEKVVYYNSNPPFDPLILFEKTEVVYHACEWDGNYLDAEKTKDLKEFLSSNLDKIDFKFIGDL
jgi:hypothetical protein